LTLPHFSLKNASKSFSTVLNERLPTYIDHDWFVEVLLFGRGVLREGELYEVAI